MAMLCRNVTFAVGFAAERSIAALPGARVAIWSDNVGKVSAEDVTRRRAQTDVDDSTRRMANANKGSIVVPVIDRSSQDLPVFHRDSEALLNISERVAFRIVVPKWSVKRVPPLARSMCATDNLAGSIRMQWRY